MAITSVNSYPATVEGFANHWASVNATRPNDPIVLPDGTTLADFIAMQLALTTAFAALPPATSLERAASAALKIKRGAVQPRFVQFGQAIRFYLSKTRFANAAPSSPNSTDGKQTYEKAGNDMLSGWKNINAATDLTPFAPPLLLPDFDANGAPLSAGYAVATFESDLQALMDAFSADNSAGTDATQLRANRNVLLPAIYEVMKKYREACLLLLPKNSPLRATLPRLTPPAGSTPKAVVVSGTWDFQILQARLTWAAATGKDLDKLQVRGCAGPTYKAEDEEIIADLDITATHFETDWALTAPGSFACFKVYVMTTTGNENGGKAVKIVRPVT